MVMIFPYSLLTTSKINPNLEKPVCPEEPAIFTPTGFVTRKVFPVIKSHWLSKKNLGATCGEVLPSLLQRSHVSCSVYIYRGYYYRAY